jgi:P27 family predicted phage terminase small subunit
LWRPDFAAGKLPVVRLSWRGYEEVSMGRHRTATVLKILKGSVRSDTRRDESAVAPKSLEPVFLPGEVLTDDERRIVDFIRDVLFFEKVHGDRDGVQALLLARMLIRLRTAQAMVARHGLIVKHPISGKPMKSPFLQIVQETEEAIRRLMSDMGLSPSGRLRFAPPVGEVHAGNWEGFN